MRVLERGDMSRQTPRSYRTHVGLFGRGLLAFVLLAGLLVSAPVRFIEPAAAATVSYDTTTRGEADIRAMWQQYKPRYSGSPYSAAPRVTAPYAAGALKPEFAQDGLNTLNFARYLAGLPYDVTLNFTHMINAQHGAVLLAAGEFSHTPPKPAGMDQSFYNTALSSTSTSNIGSGYRDLASAQRGFLADSSNATNLRALGHRRWLLNPAMQTTGMGFVNDRSTTYVFDRSRTDTLDYGATTWPSAGCFPVEFFDSATPWSITLNPARYSWDSSGFKVTMRRISDNVTWTFTEKHTDTNGHYFSTNFAGYGVGNVFVFRPDPKAISYQPGDEFEITLSGGVYWKGTKVPASVIYRTQFMSLETAAPSGPVDIEHDAGGVVFDRWVTGRSAAYSGGGYVYSRWKDVWLEGSFTGTNVSWIGPKQPNYGKAEVSVDGGAPVIVDCYAPKGSAKAETILWESPTLAPGSHTVRIKVLGEHNPQSTGDIVVLDRFEATGTGASTPAVRVPENNTSANFTGTWVRGNNSVYVAGGYNYSRWKGSAYKATFTGTKVAWIGPKTGQYGRVEVYLDGKLQNTVCQYGPTGWRYRVWESKTLPRGRHTLELRVTGTKSAPSSGYNIVVDALDVTP